MQRLASTNAAESRAAGRALIAHGDDAVDALIDALRSGPAAVRKPSAFLLGRLPPSPRVRDALVAALSDEEPKVRKNAAIALGSAGDDTSVAPIADALARETIGWVRPSLVLSLGAIGSSAAA